MATIDQELKELGIPKRSSELPPDILLELADRFRKGETIRSLSDEYGIKVRSLTKQFAKYGIQRDDGQSSMRRKKAHIQNENISLTYRQMLAWAVEAAGQRRRTGADPVSCPNDSAYWLYEQAVSDPKGFLTKINQVEAKHDEEEGNLQKMNARSIQEIDAMLSLLDAEEALAEA